MGALTATSYRFRARPWDIEDSGSVCTENEECDAAGACSGDALPQGTPCNDGVICTENDECDGAGACVGDLMASCQIPALSPWGQALLVVLLAAAGVLLVGQRRRSVA